jgi:uncharacterized membrane protein
MYVVFLALLFIILDFIYVSIVSPQYISMISNIQQQPFKIRIVPAILSYVVLLCTLLFVVLPYAKYREKTDKSCLKTAIFSGLFVGFAIYGVFNTTNTALFRDYSLTMAIIDTLWGSFLFFTITLLFVCRSHLQVFVSS